MPHEVLLGKSRLILSLQRLYHGSSHSVLKRRQSRNAPSKQKRKGGVCNESVLSLAAVTQKQQLLTPVPFAVHLAQGHLSLREP